jgi:hypothetical protein
LDLPYVFHADGEEEEMTLNSEFDFAPLMQMAAQFMAQAQAAGNSNDPVAAAMALAQKTCGCTIS